MWRCRVLQACRSALSRSVTTMTANGRIEVEGSKLYWETHGNGPLPVLFCPGLAGSIQSNYWPVFKKMDSEQFTMIGIDPEGYGRSRPPNRNPFTEEFCLQRDARMAVEVMQQLGYEKYSVVGWSNGGLTAIIMASLFPDTVTQLVVCNAPFRASAHVVLVMNQIANLKNWSSQHRKALLRMYEEDYAVRILREWRLFVKREVDKPNHFPRIFEHFGAIKAPLLLMYGTKDAFTPAVDAWQSYDEVTLPGDRIHLIRRGSHFHLEFLDEFVQVISEFLLENKVETPSEYLSKSVCSS